MAKGRIPSSNLASRARRRFAPPRLAGRKALVSREKNAPFRLHAKKEKKKTMSAGFADLGIGTARGKETGGYWWQPPE